MSSPVGHALAGIIVFTVAKHLFPKYPWSWKEMLAFVLLAGLPDLDGLWVWIGHIPRHIAHRTVSHSIFFSVVAGVILAWLYQAGLKKRLVHFWWLFPLVILTHPLMDMSCVDYMPPRGVMLYWPFIRDFIYRPIPFMHSVGTYVVQGYPVWYGLVVSGAREALQFGSVLLLLKLMFKFQRRNAQSA